MPKQPTRAELIAQLEEANAARGKAQARFDIRERELMAEVAVARDRTVTVERIAAANEAQIRTEFTTLLNSAGGYYTLSNKPSPLSWLQIAGEIGQLKERAQFAKAERNQAATEPPS